VDKGTASSDTGSERQKAESYAGGVKSIDDHRMTKHTAPNYVYFLRCRNRVKVGRSYDINARIAAFATGNPDPITLIGAIKTTKAGAVRLEREIHHRLKHKRITKEWFELDHAVMDELSRVAEHKAWLADRDAAEACTKDVGTKTSRRRVEVTCSHCSTTFVHDAPTRKYCSIDCKKAASKKRREKPCKGCSKLHYTGNKYCSKGCHDEHRAAKVHVRCEWCGEPSRSFARMHKECRREWKKQQRTIECNHCGQPFENDQGSGRYKRRYCSRECSDASVRGVDVPQLGDRRKAAGISQPQLATLVGVTQHQIAMWERKRSGPTPEDHARLEKVLEILGV